MSRPDRAGRRGQGQDHQLAAKGVTGLQGAAHRFHQGTRDREAEPDAGGLSGSR
jgi:hypothetical protein